MGQRGLVGSTVAERLSEDTSEMTPYQKNGLTAAP